MQELGEAGVGGREAGAGRERPQDVEHGGGQQGRGRHPHGAPEVRTDGGAVAVGVAPVAVAVVDDTPSAEGGQEVLELRRHEADHGEAAVAQAAEVARGESALLDPQGPIRHRDACTTERHSVKNKISFLTETANVTGCARNLLF